MQTHQALALLPRGAPHTLCPPLVSFLHPFMAHFHSYTHVFLLVLLKTIVVTFSWPSCARMLCVQMLKCTSTSRWRILWGPHFYIKHSYLSNFMFWYINRYVTCYCSACTNTSMSEITSAWINIKKSTCVLLSVHVFTYAFLSEHTFKI